MAPQIGISKAKAFISLIASFISSLTNIDSNQDNKISFMEIWNALQVNIFKVLPVVNDLKQLKAEILNLDDEEKAELIEEFARELQLKKLTAERIIERSFEVAIHLIDLIIEVQSGEIVKS